MPAATKPYDRTFCAWNMWDRRPAIVFAWDVYSTFAWYLHSAFKIDLVSHLRQNLCASEGEHGCMSSSTSTVKNLGEFAGESGMDNIGFLYPYDPNILGQIRRLLEPYLHNNQIHE